jgi:predicted transcriptional regulator of viral defense system
MKTKSKYYKKLGSLLSKPQFSIKDAKNKGIPKEALAYLCKIGVLERVFKGIYRAANYESDIDISLESLATVASSIPFGVICLISALSYYELTDEIPREIWIAIPHKNRAPKKHGARIVRMRNMKLGQKNIKIKEYKVKIFDKERCIIDAFRYLSPEIAIKALKMYLNDYKNKPSIKKLTEYAEKLRVNIKPYILSCTT